MAAVTTLSPLPFLRFCDNSGNALVGGQLFTYQAGTTTPQATYTDSTGVTPNANPVVLNQRGEASVWLTPNTAYKFVLEDAAGNVIWSQDQIISSQLLSLYGGVDSGTANTYALTFTASFTAYTDGIVIYWVPANSNTGASTVNVNGIGVVSITNANASALVANQIVAGQPAAMMYKGGAFRLLLTGTEPLVLLGTTQLAIGTTIGDGASTNIAIGYLGIPVNTQNVNSYNTQASDVGKAIYHTDGNAYTWSLSAGHAVGSTITFVNDASAAVNLTITTGGDTMLWTPSGSTGNRVIAQFGRLICQKVASTRWFVNGTGIT